MPLRPISSAQYFANFILGEQLMNRKPGLNSEVEGGGRLEMLSEEHNPCRAKPSVVSSDGSRC